MARHEIDIDGIGFDDIDLTDSKPFADGVPHHWFAFLRENAPVWWQEESDGPGFWAVTSHADCTQVNRDYEHFSSAKKATFIWDLPEDDLAQQQMLMLNMDPPLHTRYRRLVNKGFTPKMVNQLHDRINAAADDIIDSVIEQGTADFVTDIAAELPLVVIAELLGVPHEDRHRMFDWSNRMIGSEDPEYQTGEEASQQAAMELYAYASELFAAKRADPHDDLMSVLTSVDIEGEKLSEIELELFFLLLTVAGNETTRNLISGGDGCVLRQPRPVGAAPQRPVPPAVGGRGDAALRHPGDELPAPDHPARSSSAASSSKRTARWCSSTSRPTGTRRSSRIRSASTSPATPIPTWPSAPADPTSAWAPTWPAWRSGSCSSTSSTGCPTFSLDGEVQRLQSQFINGVKHIPVAFPPAARVSA